MSDVLLDTNILVYLKDSSSQFHESCLKILSTNDRFFITSKNLSEYYAVVTRGHPPLLSIEEALEDLDEFLASFIVLYPNENSTIKLRELIDRLKPKGIKIHDIEIIAIALSFGVTKIATLNISDFKAIPELQIIQPI
jgi:predicted nucleic acid-binding protein